MYYLEKILWPRNEIAPVIKQYDIRFKASRRTMKVSTWFKTHCDISASKCGAALKTAGVTKTDLNNYCPSMKLIHWDIDTDINNTAWLTTPLQ